MQLKVKNTSGHPFKKATDRSIGFDLYAGVTTSRQLAPGQRWKVPTGIHVEMYKGLGAFVMPRSGLGLHQGVTVLTGVIDEDYRGEISAVLINLSQESYTIVPGERIAQFVPVVVPDIDEIIEVDELTDTARGASGFGSTGR